MYRNASNKLGRDENLRVENLRDKIFGFHFIGYIKRKLRVLRETGPWTYVHAGNRSNFEPSLTQVDRHALRFSVTRWPLVREKSGKFKVREKSGNFRICQGNLEFC